MRANKAVLRMTYVYCMFMRSSIRSVPPSTSSGCVYCVQDKPVHRSHIVGGCMNTNPVYSGNRQYRVPIRRRRSAQYLRHRL